jgi:putative transposase
MRAVPVVVFDVHFHLQHAPQVISAEDDDVVRALAVPRQKSIRPDLAQDSVLAISRPSHPLAIAHGRPHPPGMLFLLKLSLWTVRTLARSRQALVLENLALRQQLATVVHGARRPRLVTIDRLFWVALREQWADWSRALAIVQPSTVVAWHRRAFRGYWRRLSRKQGRPAIDAKLRELIERMVRENRWGAPRIHGEILKLGFRISERTVSRYLRDVRPRRPSGTTWKTFLDNHREALAAMDFFAVPTLTFRLLYVLLVVQHDRRKVLHLNVTAHPTALWVIQQLREAFPFELRPRYLLLDRDSIFSVEVGRALGGMDVLPVRTAYKSPWQNGVAERAGSGPADENCSITLSC